MWNLQYATVSYKSSEGQRDTWQREPLHPDRYVPGSGLHRLKSIQCSRRISATADLQYGDGVCSNPGLKANDYLHDGNLCTSGAYTNGPPRRNSEML